MTNARAKKTTGAAPDSASGPPELSYEKAREELISVVQRLESGGAPLEESLRLWERGEELSAICLRWLDGAEARVTAARSAEPAAPE